MSESELKPALAVTGQASPAADGYRCLCFGRSVRVTVKDERDFIV